MLRFTLLASTLLLAACASARTSALVASDSSHAVVLSAPKAPAAPAPRTVSGDGDHAEPFGRLESEAPGNSNMDLAALALSPAPAEESLYANRFTIKGGYYGSTEDALDDGYIVDVAWTRFLNKLFAVELEAGYVDTDGSDSGVDTDVWGVPLMLNGRLGVPIWILEVYGGLGVGGFYYDIDAKSGGLSDSDSGFIFGGNAFLGATINLADSIAIGLEGKYYATENISDFDTGLDAFALMLTLGFSR